MATLRSALRRPAVPEECVGLAMSPDSCSRQVLDPRAYHIFQFREKRLLYDVGTGILGEANDDFIFDVLDLGRRYAMPELLKCLEERHDNVSEQRIRECISPMAENGLFTYTPLDGSGREATIERLIEHHPRRIQIFVAQACNMRCTYCYAEENGSNDRGKLMTFEEAKRAVDHLVEASHNRRHLSIQFFGGEPLLNFEVIKRVVDYAQELAKSKHKTFHYQISTNGTLLTPDMESFLAEYNFGTMVSLDGTEEIHERQRPLRNGGRSYHKVLANALSLNNKFSDRGQRIKIRANLSQEFSTQVSRVVEHLESLGFRHIGISAIFPRPDGDNAGCVTKVEREMWRTQSDELAQAWLSDVLEGRPPRSPYAHSLVRKSLAGLSQLVSLPSVTCGVGRNTNAVDSDGNIFPCHRYVGMDAYIVGSTHSGLDRERLRQYYECILDNIEQRCGPCWARRLCGGPCPWEVSSESGQLVAPSDDSCDDVRHAIVRCMYIYAVLAESAPQVLERLAKEQKSDDREARSSGTNPLNRKDKPRIAHKIPPPPALEAEAPALGESQ